MNLLVRSLAGMNSHVFHKAARLNSGITAMRALVSFFP